jgi:hypothetical protein
MRRAPRLLLPVLIAATLCPPAAADPAAEPAYPLDSVPREVPATGDLGCPRIEVASYRGDVIRYRPEIWVNGSFRARLAAFGGYGCRRMREHAGWLSEHALGNAIDVAGFDFGHLPKGEALPAGLDPVFKNAFEVRVLGHWAKRAGHAAVHARFLRTLVLRLIARDDIFRVLLGPGYPGHANHFHFDVTTFRLVQIFEDGRLLQAPRSPAAPPRGG